MNEFSPSGKTLPNGLSLEKPAKNLAALAANDALRELAATVLAQWKHVKEFAALAKYGIRPVDRMLFFGPPGNGKTMASQWLASKLEVPLYLARCEALVGSYLGETAENVSRVMNWLEKQSRCVVLFDEVEQLMPARASGMLNREVGAAMTVFWQRLDRWESQTLFVLATNMRDSLDAALLSRIDLQMEFGPPTLDQAAAVIRYWMELLHEFGGHVWGEELLALAADNEVESFRSLFQVIQRRVRRHIVESKG